MAQFLHDKGYRVSVVNPQRISGFAASQMRRSKTDKLDAAVIATFCRALQPEGWTPPEPAWLELRALLRQVEDLQQRRLSPATNAQLRLRFGNGISEAAGFRARSVPSPHSLLVSPKTMFAPERWGLGSEA